MFLRKVGGTFAVFLVGAVLGAIGLERGAPQSEVTLQTIRVLTAVVPAFFLALGIWIARGYPLTRAAHARILSRLEARNRAG
jgi:GPH family glycoside/pentoside/hexuronide:cation symporter